MNNQKNLGPHEADEDGILRCPNCGHDELASRNEIERFDYGSGEDRVELKANVTVYTCKKCGLEFLDDSSEDARAQAISAHLGLLRAAEIKEIRRKYNLSQEKFCKITRLGIASLSRWERGDLLQNQGYDSLLYLLRYPENLERLRARFETPTETARAATPDTNVSKFPCLSKERIEASRQAPSFSPRRRSL